MISAHRPKGDSKAASEQQEKRIPRSDFSQSPSPTPCTTIPSGAATLPASSRKASVTAGIFRQSYADASPVLCADVDPKVSKSGRFSPRLVYAPSASGSGDEQIVLNGRISSPPPLNKQHSSRSHLSKEALSLADFQLPQPAIPTSPTPGPSSFTTETSSSASSASMASPNASGIASPSKSPSKLLDALPQISTVISQTMPLRRKSFKIVSSGPNAVPFNASHNQIGRKTPSSSSPPSLSRESSTATLALLSQRQRQSKGSSTPRVRDNTKASHDLDSAIAESSEGSVSDCQSYSATDSDSDSDSTRSISDGSGSDTDGGVDYRLELGSEEEADSSDEKDLAVRGRQRSLNGATSHNHPATLQLAHVPQALVSAEIASQSISQMKSPRLAPDRSAHSTRSNGVAVPLEPYTNQVGGHNHIFRFSQRAICKPLVSKENQFYEALEQAHPRMLAFVPQYLGVLNVTYRKATAAEAEGSAAKRQVFRKDSKGVSALDNDVSGCTGQEPDNAAPDPDIQSTSALRQVDEIPEVSLEQNRHILPDSSVWDMFSSSRMHGRSHSHKNGSSTGSGHSSSNRTRRMSNDHRRPIVPEQPRHSRQSFSNRSRGIGSQSNSRSPKMKSTVDRSISPQTISDHMQTPPTAEVPPSTPVSVGNAHVALTRPHLHEMQTDSSALLHQHERRPKDHNLLLRRASQQFPASPMSFGTGSTRVNRRLCEQVLREVLNSPRIHDKPLWKDGKRVKSRHGSDATPMHSFGKSSLSARPSTANDATIPENPREAPSPFMPQLQNAERMLSPMRRTRSETDVPSRAVEEKSLSSAEGSRDRAQANVPLPDTREDPNLTMRALVSPRTLSTADTVAMPTESELLKHNAVERRMLLRHHDLEAPCVHTSDPISAVPTATDAPQSSSNGPRQASPPRHEKFILMEDLTGSLKSPCVLDLKMGTRQFSVFATHKKRASQTAKCDETTSRTLGVRLCGMQVYKPTMDKYIFQDKYYGRNVSTADFPNVLASFLHDGEKLLVYHIPSMLQKLHRLAAITATLKRWRFYAASILLIYDGDEEAQKMYAETCKPHKKQAFGTGSSSWHSESVLKHTNLMAGFHSRRSSADERPSHSSQHGPHHHHHHHHQHHKRKIGNVTIRLIDFAHCTSGDDFLYPDEEADEFDSRPRATFPPTHPNLADTGFLLGLQSLCVALEYIWEKERVWRRNNPHLGLEPLEALDTPDAQFWDSVFEDGIIEEARSHGYEGREGFRV